LRLKFNWGLRYPVLVGIILAGRYIQVNSVSHGWTKLFCRDSILLFRWIINFVNFVILSLGHHVVRGCLKCSWFEIQSCHLCNQCLSPLTLWVQIPLRQGVLDTTLCDKVCQWLTTVLLWFSLGILVSSTKKTDRNDIAEMFLSTIAIAKLILSWPPLLENSLIDLISSQKLLKFESEGHNLELVISQNQ